MAWQKQDDQLENTFSSYVRIQDVALKTCQRRWTIGKSAKRGSGISVLPARHDDDNDDWSNISIWILSTLYRKTWNYVTEYKSLLVYRCNHLIKNRSGSIQAFMRNKLSVKKEWQSSFLFELFCSHSIDVRVNQTLTHISTQTHRYTQSHPYIYIYI